MESSKSAGAATDILAWEDDPGEPGSKRQPIRRPRPRLRDKPLPVRINEPAPRRRGEPGTPAFRYWTAADALRRASDLWGGVVGRNVTWYSTVGRTLEVDLDCGSDFNAYYDRGGLRFFHGSTDGQVCYSGESPDVVSHEHGHALLDAVRPELFDAPFAEAAAFHEAFGDVSALLCALQLESVREAVLAKTDGRIHRDSQVSRMAEQLGWAIRQIAPDAVDRTALRNAANRWFYRPPAELPPSAPATELSSESHSFSRVFTGAFLRALSGMLATRPDATPAALLDVTADAARLLYAAIREAPVVPEYLSQAAAHILAADDGTYRKALSAAFARHGLLSVTSAAAVTADYARRVAPVDTRPQTHDLVLAGAQFGLADDVVVRTPVQPRRFAVAGASADVGAAAQTPPERAAASFLEDLFRQGRIELQVPDRQALAFGGPVSRATHELVPGDDGLVLERRRFDCRPCRAG